MNSTINTGTKLTIHTVSNAEFTGVFDRKIFKKTKNHVDSVCDYHLFIKYGDKVYMDVKGVGDIVISFTELQQNKFWKYYFDLSLLLTNDKNLVFQCLNYSSDYLDEQIYKDERLWSIDTAIIEFDMVERLNKIINYDYSCFYRINPYDLDKMQYTTQARWKNNYIIFA